MAGITKNAVLPEEYWDFLDTWDSGNELAVTRGQRLKIILDEKFPEIRQQMMKNQKQNQKKEDT